MDSGQTFGRGVFPMPQEQIKKYIPHRDPFLLIDSILELVPHSSLIATKRVSPEDPVLRGHFPNRPIYPGVLMVEGLAQASCVLGHYSLVGEGAPLPEAKYLLTQINKAKFKGQVLPGHEIQYQIKLERHKMNFYWFSGTARVEDNIVMQAELSACLTDFDKGLIELATTK